MEHALGAVRLILESRNEPGIEGMLAQARQVLALTEDDERLVPGDTAGVDLEQFLDLSPDLFCILRSDMRPLVVNDAWRRSLGYSRAELLERGLTFCVYRSDLERLRQEFQRMHETGETGSVRVRYVASDGVSVYWIHWLAAQDPRTGLFYGVGRDVTAETAAAQMREQMMTTLQENSALLAEQAAELDGLRERAEHLANHDDLTGLWNRRAWFAQAVRSRPAGVALIDVDHFKEVNDTYGHAVGDSVLTEIANRLREVVGDTGTVGRVGGEEFAVQFYVSPTRASKTCEAIIRKVARRPVVVKPGIEVGVSVSVGFSPWLRMGSSREQSLAATYDAADRALYLAKEAGRNRLITTGTAA